MVLGGGRKTIKEEKSKKRRSNKEFKWTQRKGLPFKRKD